LFVVVIVVCHWLMSGIMVVRKRHRWYSAAVRPLNPLSTTKRGQALFG